MFRAKRVAGRRERSLDEPDQPCSPLILLLEGRSGISIVPDIRSPLLITAFQRQLGWVYSDSGQVSVLVGASIRSHEPAYVTPLLPLRIILLAAATATRFSFCSLSPTSTNWTKPVLLAAANPKCFSVPGQSCTNSCLLPSAASPALQAGAALAIRNRAKQAGALRGWVRGFWESSSGRRKFADQGKRKPPGTLPEDIGLQGKQTWLETWQHGGAAWFGAVVTAVICSPASISGWTRSCSVLPDLL